MISKPVSCHQCWQWTAELDRRRGGGEKYSSRHAVLHHELVDVHVYLSHCVKLKLLCTLYTVECLFSRKLNLQVCQFI